MNSDFDDELARDGQLKVAAEAMFRAELVALVNRWCAEGGNLTGLAMLGVIENVKLELNERIWNLMRGATGVDDGEANTWQ